MFTRIVALPQVELCMQRGSKTGIPPLNKEGPALANSRLSPCTDDEHEATKLPSTPQVERWVSWANEAGPVPVEPQGMLRPLTSTLLRGAAGRYGARHAARTSRLSPLDGDNKEASRLASTLPCPGGMQGCDKGGTAPIEQEATLCALSAFAVRRGREQSQSR